MNSFLKKRHRKEKYFKYMGLLSLSLALLFLLGIFCNIIYQGVPAFFSTKIAPEVGMADLLNPHALYQIKEDKRWIAASDDVDMYYKYGEIGRLVPDTIREIESLKSAGKIRLFFNKNFFTHSDSREPEIAGIWGALIGSILTLLINFLTSFPLGIGTAIYLEEFAPKNLLTQWIEANINNLAAVPSILFGLLGVVFFIHFFGLPRPSALVGGLTLGLMSLPIIVVSTRAALSTVPSNLKEAALGLGATPLQILFHHTIPVALPGITTGVLLSLARALGETAPLLMIGMVAFIGSPPSSLLDPTTVLPVQIFNWSRSPEMGFIEKTSGAILVLLFILVILNSCAVLIRKKFET